jgi:hypothetical protein
MAWPALIKQFAAPLDEADDKQREQKGGNHG